MASISFQQQQRNVLFVADLPKETTYEDLVSFFKDYHFQYASLINNKPQSVWAKVCFENEEYAIKAKHELNGEILQPQNTLGRIKGKPVRICNYEVKGLSNNEKNPKQSLLVKNLDGRMSQKEFYQIFLQYGEVDSAKIEYDELGNSKGFGYIYYNNEESAEKAKNCLNRKDYYGKPLDIVNLIPFKSKSISNNALFIMNFPTSFTENDLKKLFAKYGEVKYASISKNENGTSKGFGLITFENPEVNSICMTDVKANQICFPGLPPLVVKFAVKKEEREKKMNKAIQSYDAFKIQFSLLYATGEVNNENDLNKEIRLFIKVVMLQEYNPQDVIVDFMSKSGVVTFHNRKEFDTFLQKYQDFSAIRMPAFDCFPVVKITEEDTEQMMQEQTPQQPRMNTPQMMYPPNLANQQHPVRQPQPQMQSNQSNQNNYYANPPNQMQPMQQGGFGMPPNQQGNPAMFPPFPGQQGQPRQNNNIHVSQPYQQQLPVMNMQNNPNFPAGTSHNQPPFNPMQNQRNFSPNGSHNQTFGAGPTPNQQPFLGSNSFNMQSHQQLPQNMQRPMPGQMNPMLSPPPMQNRMQDMNNNPSKMKLFPNMVLLNDVDTMNSMSKDNYNMPPHQHQNQPSSMGSFPRPDPMFMNQPQQMQPRLPRNNQNNFNNQNQKFRNNNNNNFRQNPQHNQLPPHMNNNQNYWNQFQQMQQPMRQNSMPNGMNESSMEPSNSSNLPPYLMQMKMMYEMNQNPSNSNLQSNNSLNVPPPQMQMRHQQRQFIHPMQQQHPQNEQRVLEEIDQRNLENLNPTELKSQFNTNQPVQHLFNPEMFNHDENEDIANEIADSIYDFASQRHPDEAAKITGMIREMGIQKMNLLLSQPDDLMQMIDQAYEMIMKNK